MAALGILVFSLSFDFGATGPGFRRENVWAWRLRLVVPLRLVWQRAANPSLGRDVCPFSPNQFRP